MDIRHLSRNRHAADRVLINAAAALVNWLTRGRPDADIRRLGLVGPDKRTRRRAPAFTIAVIKG